MANLCSARARGASNRALKVEHEPLRASEKLPPCCRQTDPVTMALEKRYAEAVLKPVYLAAKGRAIDAQGPRRARVVQMLSCGDEVMDLYEMNALCGARHFAERFPDKLADGIIRYRGPVRCGAVQQNSLYLRRCPGWPFLGTWQLPAACPSRAHVSAVTRSWA